MIKVITYGTYDLLHYGHIKLLKRAKALGDYLIVAVTADDFDKSRGKINVQQSLIERIEAVRSTGLADEIIVEEYDGQKIDDIKRLGVDIFTVGSDWVGTFDYLNEYCKVVYLDRTEGVSSSKLRSIGQHIRIGLVGDSDVTKKFYRECQFVNGVEVSAIYTHNKSLISMCVSKEIMIANNYNDLLNNVDAVYIVVPPSQHYKYIKSALEQRKHVICESPIVTTVSELEELNKFASVQGCILMEALKTAYSTAYYRLLLLVKSGKIGDVVSIDATCTSLKNIDVNNKPELDNTWNSICAWGPTAMLPIFQILGTNYEKKNIYSKFFDFDKAFDSFTKIDFFYASAVASVKVGKGVKSEGSLVISGTKGYVYVPAPWWKTDYFEIRYENISDNKRYFYQLDGEGIRYEIVAFVKAINNGYSGNNIDFNTTKGIVDVIESYYKNCLDVIL